MPCPKALFRQSKSRHSKSTTRPVTTVFLLTRSTPCKSRTLRSQGRVPYLRCPIGERWIDYSRYRRFISFKSDRKSTRLNSSHVAISYAVFCLKKKKRKQTYETSTASAEGRQVETK